MSLASTQSSHGREGHGDGEDREGGRDSILRGSRWTQAKAKQLETKDRLGLAVRELGC